LLKKAEEEQAAEGVTGLEGEAKDDKKKFH
jgi:hypothetical protein